MIESIILIVLLIFLFLNIQENFIVNPNLHMKKFLEIDKHFRECRKNNGFYYCVKSNPYRKVIPYELKIPKQKKVWYLKYKKVSDLLPVNLNK